MVLPSESWADSKLVTLRVGMPRARPTANRPQITNGHFNPHLSSKRLKFLCTAFWFHKFHVVTLQMVNFGSCKTKWLLLTILHGYSSTTLDCQGNVSVHSLANVTMVPLTTYMWWLIPRKPSTVQTAQTSSSSYTPPGCPHCQSRPMAPCSS